MSAIADRTPDRPRPEREIGKWSATMTVMLGMMATILSSTMVNVAIPNIMGTFGVGQDRAHWMSSGFLSAMTVTMLLNAWFVRNFGVRNTFTFAVTVFTFASIYGQISPSFDGIVAARIIQGACAGLLQPLALTVIFSAYPPEERGKAMGMFGMGVVLGPVFGPTIGGFIIDNADWRFVFTAALPVTFVAGVLGVRFLPGRDDDTTPLQLNWTSFALVTTAVFSLLTGISNLQSGGWDSGFVFAMLLTSALSAIAFVVVESRTAHPLLQVRLFANRTFALSALVAFMFGAGMFGSIYLMPIFVQTVQGFTATKAGLLLMLSGLVLVVVFPIAGRLAGRVAPGYPIATGMCLFGISSYFLASGDVNTSFLFLTVWTAFGRIGLGLVTPSLNTGALAAISPELFPYGAGALNFTRMLGGSLGVNILAMVLEQRTARHFDILVATQTPGNSATREMLRQVDLLLQQQGIAAIDRIALSYHYLAQVVGAKANALAFQDGFMVLAIGFAVAALSALMLTRRPVMTAEG